MENLNTFTASNELSKADLGDERLNHRLVKLAESISRRPRESFPDIANSTSELEATYRFFSNSRVTPENILAPHIEATVSRACCGERIVVAHDTTEFLFGGKSRKEELGWTIKHNQGFFGHFSLALSRTDFVRPLGVLGIDTIFRPGEPRSRKRTTYEIKRDPKRESQRWWNSVHRVENLFPLDIKPIHVMDREADDFELFSDLCAQQIRFVIRVRHDRKNCQIPGEASKAKLSELLQEKEIVCEREVSLGNREQGPTPQRYKPRSPRIAKLHVKALTFEMPKTASCLSTTKTLILNCVHVYEVDAPQDAEPIDWKLITLEPITSAEQVLNIIDDYRARWTIEEYFKALKTGCSYEKRQLESRESLLNALAVFAPIAWQLLLLRTLNRHKPDAPAEQALRKIQIEVLRAVSKKKPLPQHPTIQEALLAIAALGGHIPNNGEPGWQILSRGMEKLLTMEIAWIAAKECFLEDRAAFGEERPSN